MKWENPILVSLSGATETQGATVVSCESGSNASGKCLNGGAPVGGDCGVGSVASNWCDSGSSAGDCIGGSNTT